MSETTTAPHDTGRLDLAAGHFAGIDLFRGLAAVALVYLHAVGGTAMADSGTFARVVVPFFSASAVMFAFLSGRKAGRSAGRYVGQRALRILLPYVAWSAVYLAFRYGGSAALGGPPPEPKWQWLISGLSHHLWFLPYIFLATSAAFLITRWCYRPGGSAAVVGVLLVGAGVASAVLPPPWVARKLGYPAVLSYETLPAACWTLGVLFLWQGLRGIELRRRPVAVVSWPVLIAGMGWLVWCGRAIPLENVLGLAALGAALCGVAGAGWAGWAKLGAWAYGIYLAHVLFVEGFQDVADKLGLNESWGVTLGVFVLALLASLAVCAALSYWRWGWTLGVPQRAGAGGKAG